MQKQEMQQDKKIFCDTNVLLNPKFDFNNYSKIYISIVSIEELDGLKRNENTSYRARQAIKNIMSASNVEIKLDNSFSGMNRFIEHGNDNIILSMALGTYTLDNEVCFLSDDYNLIVKSKALGLPCRMFECNDKEIYTGYKKLSGNTEFINNLFNDIDNNINTYNFMINEYLILHNTDLNDTNEYRFDGNGFVNLKLPSTKIIKGHNSVQRCALDLLFNKDIPIKIVAGGFGTGKTISAVKVGLHYVVDKEIYKTLVYIRNPIPVDDTDIGFLPGSKDEKIHEYCKPFLQYIQNDKDQFYAENLIKNEKIKMDAVTFLKGVSIEDSFVIMDEAEDLNLKLLKTIGSRIGNKSCIVFTGDWEQSEKKYKYDNGLLKLIHQKKGDSLIGVVVLDEVLRSPVSKLFNDLK